jgi:hypothetical protein
MWCISHKDPFLKLPSNFFPMGLLKKKLVPHVLQKQKNGLKLGWGMWNL